MQTNKFTVLLVEDEKIVQIVHLAMLKKIGCRVDLAKNAGEALEKFIGGYTIILMDVGLPDKSGIDVTREIRQNEHGKHIPVVVLTAYTDDKIKKECLEAGANAVFTKPISLAMLENILSQYT